MVVLHKDQCICCTADTAIAIPVTDNEIPKALICPHCVIGLGHLHRDKDVQQIRVVQINIHGNSPLWWVITDKKLELDHGSVYQSDETQVSYGEDETRLYGSVVKDTAPIYAGQPDFWLTRDHYNDPEIYALFNAIYQAAEERRG